MPNRGELALEPRDRGVKPLVVDPEIFGRLDRSGRLSGCAAGHDRGRMAGRA
jgi:hypothetical protein